MFRIKAIFSDLTINKSFPIHLDYTNSRMSKKCTVNSQNPASSHNCSSVFNQKNSLFSSTWLQILICLLIASAACIPMLNGTIFFGSDTAFHINRIQALVEALQAGYLRPRIYWGFNYGFGYGAPLFYSDFFLYIPALLELMGLGMIPAYRLFLFLIFFFTAFTMYRLIMSVCPNGRSVAWFGALLYVFCNYVYYDTYHRGAIGEALAYIFIPVVLYAMHSLFYQKKNHLLSLIIGFSGLLLSHNITFFLTCIFFAVVCVIHQNQILKDQKLLIKIITAAAAAFLLTAWFSLPMLEQLNTHLYRISSYFNQGSTLHQSAVHIADLLNVVPLNADRPAIVTVGLGLLILPAWNLLPKLPEKNSFVQEMTIAGYLMLLMTTVLFPWNLFPFMSFIQFPHRFFTLCSAPLCLSAACALQRIPRKEVKLLLACIFLLGIPMQIQKIYSEKGAFDDNTDPQMMKNNYFLQTSKKEWYDVPQLSTPDYLPAGTSINYIDYGRIVNYNGKIIDAIDETNYGQLSFAYQGSGKYTVPLTYYKGYSATAYQNDTAVEKPKCEIDPKTGCVTFYLNHQASQNIMIEVSYSGTNLQEFSEILSSFALFYLLSELTHKLLSKKYSRKKHSSKQ